MGVWATWRGCRSLRAWPRVTVTILTYFWINLASEAAGAWVVQGKFYGMDVLMFEAAACVALVAGVLWWCATPKKANPSPTIPKKNHDIRNY
jgi:hypothetical protein